MSPFWRALLVGFAVVALVLLGEGYGHTLRGRVSAARPRMRPLGGWSDVPGIQWLMALGASIVGAAVLLAILVTALPMTPRSGVPEATREAALGSAIRSSSERPYLQQKLPQDSDRAALARAEARESRQRDRRVSR